MWIYKDYICIYIYIYVCVCVCVCVCKTCLVFLLERDKTSSIKRNKNIVIYRSHNAAHPPFPTRPEETYPISGTISGQRHAFSPMMTKHGRLKSRKRTPTVQYIALIKKVYRIVKFNTKRVRATRPDNDDGTPQVKLVHIMLPVGGSDHP